ncbi:MAG TPA: protein phosphatase 2C domain-containing protein [Longimicrobiales bacterium]
MSAEAWLGADDAPAAPVDPGVLSEQAVLVTVGACTDAGQRRAENQDDFLVADLTVPPGEGGLLIQADDVGADPGSARCTLGSRGLLALVADGMGGAAGGRIASQLAVVWTYRELVRRLAQEPLAPERCAEALRAAVAAAGSRVHEQGKLHPQYSGMGSTMTAVVLLGPSCFIAQVGDSRAYLVRGGRPHRLTRDQSLVQQLVDAGALTPEQAAHSAHGSLLLQALGTAPELQVDLTWQPGMRGDTLVLCSDGLYRLVSDEEIAAASAGIPDPALLCRTLVALANERGGPDNVTVVAARLDGAGLPAADG